MSGAEEPRVTLRVTTTLMEKVIEKLKTHRDTGPARHPGKLLRDTILPALNLTVAQAARDLCVSRQTLHRILSGEAAISPDMAVRLERLCGVPWQFWLDHQHRADIERITVANRDLLPRIPHYALPESVMKRIGARHDG
jgi:antitoxin HigA-1